MDSIYRDIILDHYKNPRNIGKLKEPDVTTEVENPLCGDKISFQLRIKNKRVVEVGYETLGCVISTAAASMLSEHIKGMTIQQVKKLDKKDVLKLLGIELGAVRAKCALLPLEALSKSINSLQ